MMQIKGIRQHSVFCPNPDEYRYKQRAKNTEKSNITRFLVFSCQPRERKGVIGLYNDKIVEVGLKTSIIQSIKRNRERIIPEIVGKLDLSIAPHVDFGEYTIHKRSFFGPQPFLYLIEINT